MPMARQSAGLLPGTATPGCAPASSARCSGRHGVACHPERSGRAPFAPDRILVRAVTESKDPPGKWRPFRQRVGLNFIDRHVDRLVLSGARWPRGALRPQPCRQDDRHQQPGQERILRLPSGHHVHAKKQGHSARQRQLVDGRQAVESVPHIAGPKRPPPQDPKRDHQPVAAVDIPCSRRHDQRRKRDFHRGMPASHGQKIQHGSCTRRAEPKAAPGRRAARKKG